MKTRKLSKLRKLIGEKISKSQNSAKSKKNLFKNENLTNFSTIKARAKFLIPDTKTAFDYL